MKYKKSLLANLGLTAVSQMIILMFVSLGMITLSILLILSMCHASFYYKFVCDSKYKQAFCSRSLANYLNDNSGAWGGFNSSAYLSTLQPDSLASEQLSFLISNGAQVLYSMLYLLLIYNITLISMEHEWGKYEKSRRRPRCTIIQGDAFEESYLFQIPKIIIYPAMAFSSVVHWLLGQAISTTEVVWSNPSTGETHSAYSVSLHSQRVVVES